MRIAWQVFSKDMRSSLQRLKWEQKSGSHRLMAACRL